MAQRGRTGNGPGRRPRPGGAAGRASGASRAAARRPASSRPTGARRTAAPRPPRRLTRRAVVLALVLVALVLAYAYPVRTYLSQRSEINGMKQHQAAQRRHIATLQHKLDRWDDPRYVEDQARIRMRMVRPGDRLYDLYDARDTGAGRHRDPARVGDTGPWFGKLWSSVRGASGQHR